MSEQVFQTRYETYRTAVESYLETLYGEVAAVVAAPVPLPLLISLVPGSLGQFLRLGLQQLVQCFLYAPTHKFFEFALDYGLV